MPRIGSPPKPIGRHLPSRYAHKFSMNFSFAFQVVGMDVVETDGWISLAAATRNAMLFMTMPQRSHDTSSAEIAASRLESMSPMQSEERAEPAEASSAGADAAPVSVGAGRDVTTAPSDWGSALGAVVTRTSAEDGVTEVRSGEWMEAPVMRHLLERAQRKYQAGGLSW